MRIFKIPIHYLDYRRIFSVDGTTRTDAPEVNDNDHRTSSNQTTYIAEMHGDTDTTNTESDWFAVIGSDISDYSIEVPTGKGSGDGVSNRVIPSTVTAADGTIHSTTIDGIQYDLFNLNTSSTVVNRGSLRTSGQAVTNTLSGVTDATTLTISLERAQLRNPATAGMVVITGENPAGTTVTQTISYPNHELTQKKITTQAYITVSSVSVAGFRRGFITVTGNNAALNCTEAQVTFTGTPVIYEMMFLKELLYIDPEFDKIDYNAATELNSILQDPNIRGEITRINSLASRSKRSSTYRTLFNANNNVSAREFMRIVTDPDNLNFVFEEDFNRYPDRVYPATWGQTQFGERYFTRRIESGVTIDYVVQEI